MEYRTPSPKAKKLMRITAAMNVFFFLIVPSAILFGYLGKIGYTLYGGIVFCICLILGLLFFIFSPPVRFKRYKYMIADDRIEIIEGLFWISRTIVPIDRIHQIDIKRGPIDTYVGVEKVSVTTAGSSASFRFLDPETADEIAMILNKRVGSVAAAVKSERMEAAEAETAENAETSETSETGEDANV